MKVILFSILSFFLTLLLVGVAFACSNTTNSFASEVLLNKPGVLHNLSGLRDTGDVISLGDSLVWRSHFHRDVAVVLTELKEGVEEGLSVKIQIPTEEVRMGESYLFISNNKTIRDEYVFYPSVDIHELGWTAGCTEDVPPSSCGMYKDDVYIGVDRIGYEERYAVFLRVRGTEVSDEMERDVEKVLSATGLFKTYEEFTQGAKVWREGEEWIELEPALDVNPATFNFSEALGVELRWLMNAFVVNGLTDSDVSGIVSLAKRGIPGHDSRVRYFDGEWVFGVTRMMEMQGVARVSVPRDCSGFPLSILRGETVQNVTSTIKTPSTTTVTSTLDLTEAKGLPAEITYVAVAVAVVVVITVVGLVLKRRAQEPSTKESREA